MLLKINKENPITWKGKYGSIAGAAGITSGRHDNLSIWVAVGGTPSRSCVAARLGFGDVCPSGRNPLNFNAI